MPLNGPINKKRWKNLINLKSKGNAKNNINCDENEEGEHGRLCHVPSATFHRLDSGLNTGTAASVVDDACLEKSKCLRLCRETPPRFLVRIVARM